MRQFLDLIIAPPQYHSNGRLKTSEVSNTYRRLKSSAGDVVSLSAVATASRTDANYTLTDLIQRVRG